MAAGIWKQYRSQVELSEFRVNQRQVTQDYVADEWSGVPVVFFPLGFIWPSGAHVSD